MTCPKEAELALHGTGDASERLARRVGRHIRMCASCARKVSEFQLVRSAVASSGSAMPPGAREHIRAAILARVGSGPPGRPRSHSSLLLLRIACAVTVVAASAALVRTAWFPPVVELAPLSALRTPGPPESVLQFSAPRTEDAGPSTGVGREQLERTVGLQSAQLDFVQMADGLARVAQLRIPAEDPSLEIHWIIE